MFEGKKENKKERMKGVQKNLYSKLVTVVEGDPKALFSRATTPRSGGGATPFPGLLHFTLDPYLIMLSVKHGGIKYHFFYSLVLFNLGLNPGFPVHWLSL